MVTRGGDPTEPTYEPPASSGIEGLDQILRGGFPRDEMHLIQGAAGTGKTTLALQYLLAGVRAGESALYLTLSQTKRTLETIARSHGWSLEGMGIHEMSPGGLLEHLTAQHQTVLPTEEVELDEITRELYAQVEHARPRRLVFDSLGVLALLAGSRSRYHREIVALRQFLAGHGCTALFVSDSPLPTAPGIQSPANSEFDNLATSIIHLEQAAPEYGELRRRVRVIKVRSVAFQGGYHHFTIRTGGLAVYPRLQGSSAVSTGTSFQPIPSGLEPLDQLLGGGLEQGTACLLIGPPGTGKSTLASIYTRSAARAGKAGAIFLFDERVETFKERSRNLGVDLQPHIDSGQITMQKESASEITPGEFAQRVREAVEEREARVVVIDSLTGYFNAMGNTPMLAVQMHELLDYLGRSNVLTLLLVTQEGLMSVGSRPVVDVSYLSDSIIVLRMFEADGAIRRCMAAIKKRQGEHETTVRELFIRPGVVEIADRPLRGFKQILTGDPERVERVEADPRPGPRGAGDAGEQTGSNGDH